MNLATLMILIAVGLLLILALRAVRRHRLLGRCGGDCSQCLGGCASRSRHKNEQ